MTEEWHHFAQTVSIDAAREGHFIELALVPTVSTLKASTPTASSAARAKASSSAWSTRGRVSASSAPGIVVVRGHESPPSGPAARGRGRRMRMNSNIFFLRPSSSFFDDLLTKGEGPVNLPPGVLLLA